MKIRHALIAVAVATAAVATATPAFATTTVVAHRTSPAGINVVGIGSAQAVPNTDGTVNVLMSCQAVAAGQVEETGVGCYLVGSVDQIGYYIPDAWNGGNVVQTSYEYFALPGQVYSMCLNVGINPQGPAGRITWLGTAPQCAIVTV